MSRRPTYSNVLIPRVLLGSLFLFSGFSGFVGLFQPENHFTSEGMQFIRSLKDSGFFWPMLKLAEIVAGILLIFGFAGQLGVLVLAPICLGILLFHYFLSPSGSELAIAAIALEGIMLFVWRKNIAAIFRGEPELRQVRDEHRARHDESSVGDYVSDESPSLR